MLGVFDTLTGLRSHARIFSYVFGVGVKEMVSISDYLRFLRTKNGIFFTLTGVFDSSFRLERARKLYEYPIARGSKISPSVIIETLLSFGWIHSSHLGKPHSYYISGGEIYLRDDLIYSTISFFGDEIDDIRTGCTDSLMPSEMIYIYHTGSPNLPEVALSMSDDIHLGDDTCVVGFDLDFWTERVKLFQQVEHFMAFESQGISLGIEPWTTENLDTFADFLRSSDPDTVRLLSAHPLAIERFLLHNSLPYTVEKVPRL